MILYTLKCSNQHKFESWFQSASAFDKLKKARMVSCPHCNSHNVEKALMAPKLSKGKGSKASPKKLNTRSKEQKMVEKILHHIRDNSDYVGREFATKARAIHAGDLPARAIYGEAKPKEAKELLEEGISIAPLPIIPPSKAN